jgi:hypothetical protein
MCIYVQYFYYKKAAWVNLTGLSKKRNFFVCLMLHPVFPQRRRLKSSQSAR